ncbi:hypothetical protein EV363DRAFT_1460284 [Boletus edulis]|nr:hypothetical protein EV363DRAFT_1460284 [Boletus edulis]
MSPKKRKRINTVSDTEASLAQPSKARALAGNGPMTKPGACARCRKAKMRCETVIGATACRKCTDGGHECVPQESRTRLTRGDSVPPVDLQAVAQASNEPRSRRKLTHQPSTFASALYEPNPTRSRSQSTSNERVTAPDATRQLNKQVDDDDLYVIPEVDDVPEFDDDYRPITPSYETHVVNLDLGRYSAAANALTAVTIGGHLGDSDLDAETHNGSEQSENFDMDVGESSDGGESRPSSEDDEESLQMQRAIQKRPRVAHSKFKPKPIPVPHGVAKGKQKAAGSTHRRASSAKPVETSSYDPEDCTFTIRCTAPRPDGSYAPFEIKSTIDFDTLRIAIGKKTERFAGLIRPQYRLDCDKAKQSFISVQSDDELEMFIRRMRSLIVPPRLANGKPSTRAPKDPLVQFGDASVGGDSAIQPSNNNKGAKAGPSGASKQTFLSESSGTDKDKAEGSDRRKELIRQLMERWKCAIHAKGSEHPVYCYTPSGGNVCYPLTIQNIAFWALQIMEGRATINEKPVGLPTGNPKMHDSSRHGVGVQPLMPGNSGYPAAYGYPPPPVIQVYPPPGNGCGASGQCHHHDQLGAGRSQSRSQSRSRSPHSEASQLTRTQHLTASDTSHHSSRIPHASNPSITDWFTYLDRDAERNQDGVTFTPFGHLLKEKGFTRLSQLSHKYVGLSDLEDWLGIQRGTAITIFQYVDEDLEAIRSGEWVFPGHS